MFFDVAEFTKIKMKRTGKAYNDSLDPAWIGKMIEDELTELREGTTEAEHVDALLDIVYYIFDCLAQTGLPIMEIWQAIHAANMSKFTLPGGYMITEGPRTGKWEKPPRFVSPDAEIARIIETHRTHEKT